MRIGSACAIAVAVSGLMVGEAAAQGFSSSVRQDIGRAYVGATAGLIIPDNVHETVSVSGAVVGSGDFSFNTGAAVTGLIGYHVNDYLAGEGELGFGAFDYDNFSGTPIDGRVTTILGVANVIVTPLGRSRFTPYFGAGVGFASFDDKINSIDGFVVNSSGSATDFAANIIAGFDVAVADRWSVGGRYRFLWVNSAATFTDGSTTIKRDDFTAHILTANATFHF